MSAFHSFLIEEVRNMSIQAALEDLHKDVKKRSLPDLLDRDFVNVSGCESEVTVMQWNVLAQGKYI